MLASLKIKIGIGGLTPSASVTSLMDGAENGAGKKKGKGKDKGKKKEEKGKKGKKGEEEEGKEEKDLDAPPESLQELMALYKDDPNGEGIDFDETSDIRSQALTLLTSSGSFLSEVGLHGSAFRAFINAAEAAGSATQRNKGQPVEALRCLLKAQAAMANEWFRKIRDDSTESDPMMRERTFGRRLERCEAFRGGNGNESKLEDLAFEACENGIGGRFGTSCYEFPPFMAASNYLREFSTPWKRMTVGGVAGVGGGGAMVDDLLAAMPEEFRLVCLQMNEDRTLLFGAVVGGGKMPR